MKLKNNKSTNNIKTFSDQELREALFDVALLMERALVPFFVLGKTGRHLFKYEENLDGDDEIRVGVRKAELRREAIVTIEQFKPDMVVSEFQMSYSFNDIPVIIDIIHTDYAVLKHPDTRYYYTEEFKIPNPWDQYWERREYMK